MLPDSETLATSAKLASAFTTAAQPASLSKPEERNSLNQTSPLLLVTLVFFKPKTMVLNSAKVGLPLTVIL